MSEQELCERLLAIASGIATQDNAATAHPYYIVQQRREIAGIDPDYHDDAVVVWVQADWAVYEADDEFEALENGFQETGDEPEHWRRTHQIEIWEFVTAFLTRKGAQEYIEAQRHNLNKPRIYVESAHRNREIIALRESLLLALDTQPAEAAL